MKIKRIINNCSTNNNTFTDQAKHTHTSFAEGKCFHMHMIAFTVFQHIEYFFICIVELLRKFSYSIVLCANFNFIHMAGFMSRSEVVPYLYQALVREL